MYDFHTHTFLSDGVLSPVELIRRAYARGYKAIAITDHVNFGNLEYVVKTLAVDCKRASARWDILAIPGVEITHVPKEDIDMVARDAKKMGARLVNVHGETVVEPVEPGTNSAALRSDAVDILAHPGLLSPEDAVQARDSGKFLEITARRGHSLSNGRVAKIGLANGASLILDSDAHQPDDLLTPAVAEYVALGAGLSHDAKHQMLSVNPCKLLERIGYSVSV